MWVGIFGGDVKVLEPCAQFGTGFLSEGQHPEQGGIVL